MKILTMILILTISLGCNSNINPGYETPKQKGKEAYRADVPSTANPYQGARNHTQESQAWLDGWIEAKKEDTK